MWQVRFVVECFSPYTYGGKGHSENGNLPQKTKNMDIKLNNNCTHTQSTNRQWMEGNLTRNQGWHLWPGFSSQKNGPYCEKVYLGPSLSLVLGQKSVLKLFFGPNCKEMGPVHTHFHRYTPVHKTISADDHNSLFWSFWIIVALVLPCNNIWYLV